MIPLSCADFTFPLLDHDSAIQLIQMLDLEGVDIGLFCGRSHLRPEYIKGREVAAAREIRAKLGDLGLKISDVFVQTGEEHTQRAANHPDAAERAAGFEIFRSALEFAAEAGCRHVSGLPGMVFDGMSPSDALSRAAEESSRRAAEAAKLGLSYGVEAHIGSVAPTPALALELIRQSEGLTLTLDYGHFIYAGFSNEEVHPLLEHASHFHARGGAPKQLQAVLSDNTIDFAAITRRLAARNYPGWLCVEYVWINWEGCNRVDNVSETILLRDQLRASLDA